MSKKIKLFILSSVILNLLLIGAVIGHFASRPWHDHSRFMHAPEKHFSDRIEHSALSEKSRTLVKEKLKTLHEQKRSMFKEMREEREKTLKLLAAEPFDSAAYQKQVEATIERFAEQKQAIANNIKELATALNAEERAELVKLLESFSPERGMQGKKPHFRPREEDHFQDRGVPPSHGPEKDDE